MASHALIEVERVAYHRNGICGAPFHVVLFRDRETPDVPMIGIVFERAAHVAVFDRALLAKDEIGFGDNSWRGAHYEVALRAAAEAFEGMEVPR
jgi:hypothetical protein